MSVLTQFDAGQAFKASEDVLFQEVSGEIVLLDLASESYFGLGPVGASIWTLLGEGHTFAEMLDPLLQQFEVDRETLEKDVAELLGQLLSAGLIKLHATD